MIEDIAPLLVLHDLFLVVTFLPLHQYDLVIVLLHTIGKGLDL